MKMNNTILLGNIIGINELAKIYKINDMPITMDEFINCVINKKKFENIDKYPKDIHFYNTILWENIEKYIKYI